MKKEHLYHHSHSKLYQYSSRKENHPHKKTNQEVTQLIHSWPKLRNKRIFHSLDLLRNFSLNLTMTKRDKVHIYL